MARSLTPIDLDPEVGGGDFDLRRSLQLEFGEAELGSSDPYGPLVVKIKEVFNSVFCVMVMRMYCVAELAS